MPKEPRDPFAFNSPWVPGPIRRGARGYAQYLATTLGRSPEYITARLQRFFNLTAQLAGRYAAAAGRFDQTMSDWWLSGSSERMARTSIPRNAGIPLQYRVVANVNLVNPSTPRHLRDSEDEQTITVSLDFDHNPTQAEIVQEAMNMAQIHLPARGSPTAIETADWEVDGVDLVTIERRT